MATDSRTNAKENLQTAIITLAAKAVPMLETMVELEKQKLQTLAPLRIELERQRLEIQALSLKLQMKEMEPNPNEKLVEDARHRLELLQLEIEMERLQQSRREIYKTERFDYKSVKPA